MNSHLHQASFFLGDERPDYGSLQASVYTVADDDGETTNHALTIRELPGFGVQLFVPTSRLEEVEAVLRAAALELSIARVNEHAKVIDRERAVGRVLGLLYPARCPCGGVEPCEACLPEWWDSNASSEPGSLARSARLADEDARDAEDAAAHLADVVGQ